MSLHQIQSVFSFISFFPLFKEETVYWENKRNRFWWKRNVDDLSEPEIVLNLNLKLNLWSKENENEKKVRLFYVKNCVFWSKLYCISCILILVLIERGFSIRIYLLLFYVLRRMFYVIWYEPMNRFCVFCDSRVLCWVRFNFLSSRFWSKLEGNTLPSFW